jgi:hypothetical protein
MSEYAEIAEHFKSDTANHTLMLQREDGVFRHLEFGAPRTSMTRITVVAWPYNLLVAGSHGSFHFARYGDDTADMFGWLRGIRVDPDRWASKLVNGRDSVSEYDRDLMVAAINERVAEAIADDWAPEGLRAAVDEEVLGSHLLDTKDTAFQLVSEYEFGAKHRATCSCGQNSGDVSHVDAIMWDIRKHKADGKGHKISIRQTAGFDFDDFTEWNVDKLNYHYVWQCHAASWAIGQYDATRQAVAS